MSNEILAPKINANDDQVQIIRWHIQNGEYITKGSPLVDIETSKTIITIEAEVDGYLESYYEIDSIIKVGEPLCRLNNQLSLAVDASHKNILHSTPIENSSELLKHFHPLDSIAKSAEFKPIKLNEKEVYQVTRFSKSAKDLLNKLNISAEKFEGRGLITEETILRQEQSVNHGVSELDNTKGESHVYHGGPMTPREAALPLSKRAEIAQLMIGGQSLINSTLSISFDSMAIREALGKGAVFGDLQALILFEISQLLVKWPQFTAYCEQQKIHFYDRIDLGLAIDLGMGLKVVNIRSSEKFTAKEISEIAVDFCLRYMRNEILPEELIDSTVTVTDLSSQDILYFYPLINGFQSAIIGIGGDSSRPGHPMAINMTFDHRVSTGREVATFLNELKKRILSHQNNN
jgi:pyruvate/2-oxoglutarate dehydrogenase complex dihydrolipoamide acyltransferase (E2) component